MTWKIISTFDPKFGWPLFVQIGGDETTVEERKQLINEKHIGGTHHFNYCGPDSCPSVAISHQTDHALCRPNFCDAKKPHYSGNHGVCNSFWCWDKGAMDSFHNKNTHDEDRCFIESCPDLRKSHATDHKLCRPIFCDTVKKMHNGYDENGKRIFKEDHSLCDEYWCDRIKERLRLQAIKKLHDADDHSKCFGGVSSSCETIRGKHKEGDHSLCSSYYCLEKEISEAHQKYNRHSSNCGVRSCPSFAKEVMEIAHNAGKHDPKVCGPKSCPEIEQSHIEGTHRFCKLFYPKCKIRFWSDLLNALKQEKAS